MTKVILSGCNGAMGLVISRLAVETSGIEVVAGIDPKPTPSSEYPVFSSIEDCDVDADVIIDFSHPSALDGIIRYSLKRNLPAVIATTGLTSEHHEKILELSKKVPVFFSANMSLGVNLLIDLVKKAAKVLEEKFDIEIVEKHHNRKIDSPSGTALAIADGLNTVLSKKHEYVYDRHSKREKRSKNEIGIHSVRGGTIVGEHNVIFAGIDEILEFKHIALSKEIFAQGAIRSAIFLSQQSPGLYDMEKLINA